MTLYYTVNLEVATYKYGVHATKTKETTSKAGKTLSRSTLQLKNDAGISKEQQLLSWISLTKQAYNTELNEVDIKAHIFSNDLL